MSGQQSRLVSMVVAGVAALMAWPCSAQTMTAQIGSQRIALRTCSVLPPEGSSWSRGQSDIYDVLFVSRLEQNHTLAAFVLIEPSRDSGVTIEKLVADTRVIVEERETGGLKKRFSILSADLQPDTSLAPLAVRYRYELEDVGAKGMKGQVAVLVVHGIRVLHPDGPIVVHSTFSERAPRGVPRDDDRARRFLAGLRLTRTTDVLSPVATLGAGAFLAVRGPDAVWVPLYRMKDGKPQPGELLRMDPVTLSVTGRKPLGPSPSDIVVDEHGVDVSDDVEGTVRHFDPATLELLYTVKCGRQATRLALSGDLLWATDRERGGLWKIDRRQGKAQQVAVKGIVSPFPLLVRDGLLWMADAQNRVLVLDAVTGESRGAAVGVGSGPRALSSGAGSVWVLCRGMRAVQRIDPESRRVIATIPLPGTNPGSMVFHDGSIWVSDATEGSLARIDAATNTMTSLQAGLAAVVCAGPDGVWIVDWIAERIGRLRLPPP